MYISVFIYIPEIKVVAKLWYGMAWNCHFSLGNQKN